MGDGAFREALEKFENLYTEAAEVDAFGAPFMTLATVSRQARPTVRMVTFMGVAEGKFTFFGNERSGKGHHMASNPSVGLCFYWPQLRQQVIVEGDVVMLDEMAADKLWNSRSRSSAVMAWISKQSEGAHSREDLDDRYHDTMTRFTDVRVPRPAHWVCYGVEPSRLQFWRSNWKMRRHREVYLLSEDGWKHSYLDP